MTPAYSAAERANADALIGLALAEDLGDVGDLTSLATLPPDAMGAAWFVARSAGIIAGLPVAAQAAGRMGLENRFLPELQDGDRVEPGTRIARVEGSMRLILALERTALNFLQRLSGIASLTDRYVHEVAGTKAKILDTRKTTPGWRSLEKYAVRCGGGQNHRLGLFDAVLIKDNHLAWLGRAANPIGRAVAAARVLAPTAKFIEVEVDDLDQFDEALRAAPDIILIDNLGLEPLSEAVSRRDRIAPQILLEASGGITLKTVAGLARSGVDRISVGGLTHSAPALDIGLDFEEIKIS